MARKDIHRPSSPDFDPAAYEVHGVWDMKPDVESPYAVQERLRIINSLIARGYRSGAGSSQQCGHCGARIRYAALMVHTTTREYIYVGETCLDGRFESLTKAEFQAVRRASAEGKEAAAKAARIAALVDAHPLLADLTYPEITWPDVAGEFVSSIAGQLRRKGQLSDAQISGVERALLRNVAEENRHAEKEAAVAAGTVEPAPTGRVAVEGVITSIRDHDTDFGTSWKMVIRADAGWAVWMTCPATLIDQAMTEQSALSNDEWVGWDKLLVGRRVRVTATLTLSKDDPTFAFGKRPARPEVLAAA